ncbi:hypothetical protein ACIP98_02005 [Streptomyces sp. NPDC088354]|uniref:hypothetical protein n=1 Tax=unclassified Streptomyces TaxID=2593676 RepID=UPI0029A7D00E|nr:hypothetical protein [Streptomyces sp. MI02-7b]MDX3073607.1 hypothetical protein [Streptomyces sp. MI02-7b]
MPNRVPRGGARSAISLLAAVAAVAAGAGLLAGCGTPTAAVSPAALPVAASASPAVPSATPTPTPVDTTVPGLGPRTLKAVPAGARQVVVVTGAGRNSSVSHVVVHERRADGSWSDGPTWSAHNARDGWTTDHHVGDLRSPAGVYGLTDAGGLLPDPGSKLPYDHSTGFFISGKGFRGESLAGSFDYVVAINYNRQPGTTPRDWTRPLGASRGGGIWFHVDHGGPTQACVSLPRPDMRELLRTLDPALHPVVVMGDTDWLSR